LNARIVGRGFVLRASLVALASFAALACHGNGAENGDGTGKASSAPSGPTSVAVAPHVATATAPATPVEVGSTRPARPKLACPTGVTGASASATDTKDGIALTITAKDPAAASQVRERSHALADPAAPGGRGGGGGGGGGDGNGPSDGTGGGGGGGGGGGNGMGRCPVVMRGVTLDVQDTKDGAVVVMRPSHARDLDSVRTQVRSRLAGD
jgi:hypothetical protein